MIAMSGGEIFQLIDRNCLHREIEFPGHHHASLYNVANMEPLVKTFLQDNSIHIILSTRITDVDLQGTRIKGVIAKKKQETTHIEGDAFIDATGTAGPPANCTKYGNGCAMCVLRCHSFGGRVSIAAKAGVKEMVGLKNGQIGAMSGSCKILKESLSLEIHNELDKKGVVVVPIEQPKRLKGKLERKACQQYALPEFEENIILLNTGHAKLMTSYFPLEALRDIPGFENARYEDPYAGGLGNSIRYIGMSPRNDALRVDGVENLYCAGEKAGLLVGHTEAICTGTLAGYNAVQCIRNEKDLVLPDSLAVGDAISYVRERMQTEDGLGLKYTFSGSVFFERMKTRGLYSTNPKDIEKRVDEAGMAGIFTGPG